MTERTTGMAEYLTALQRRRGLLLGIALPMLFERLPGLRLAGGPLRWEPIFFARGLERLDVTWEV